MFSIACELYKYICCLYFRKPVIDVARKKVPHVHWGRSFSPLLWILQMGDGFQGGFVPLWSENLLWPLEALIMALLTFESRGVRLVLFEPAEKSCTKQIPGRESHVEGCTSRNFLKWDILAPLTITLSPPASPFSVLSQHWWALEGGRRCCPQRTQTYRTKQTTAAPS